MVVLLLLLAAISKLNLSKLFLGKQNSDAGREIRVYRVECDSKTVLHIGLQVML